MRLIEFRGKRIDNGEWVYGYLFVGIKSWILQKKTVDDTVGLNPFKPIEVDPETVGEFSGLHDKHAVAIYEDDIVTRKNALYKVVFMPGSFSFEGANARCNRHYYPTDFEISECWEIISNTHDDPDLLKGDAI